MCVCLTEDQLSKASASKFELEVELTKSRSETNSTKDELHRMKLASDALSQDKTDLGKIITQVHHFLTCYF